MSIASAYDVAIIGGGINGCGCAAEAAKRGMSVFLCEQADLASQTSSRSSQLIHGGLRYLEHYDFSLVKKSLDEQQVLMEIAPHLVHPLAFVLPHVPNGRSPWRLRTGLFLYDHLSLINTLPNSQHIHRPTHPEYFSPLHDTIRDGFMYYDCQTDDARLTISNALEARRHGAMIKNYTELKQAIYQDDSWQLTLTTANGFTKTVCANTLINATGPWVSSINQKLNIPQQHPIQQIKGSHLLVHRLYEGNHAYVMQHHDKRVVFVIPYHGHSLIGTTDIPFEGNPQTAHITPEEIAYFNEIIAHTFQKKIHPENIMGSWSGVRTLLTQSSNPKKAQELSRDYALSMQETPGPVLSIYGGKITTHRQLAVEAIDLLTHAFPNRVFRPHCITPLPGAPEKGASIQQYQHDLEKRYPWLPQSIRTHYLKTYGTLTELILKNCQSMVDLGERYNSVLYDAEVEYLIQHEWVKKIDDLLWRRTKLGMMPQETSMRSKLMKKIERL